MPKPYWWVKKNDTEEMEWGILESLLDEDPTDEMPAVMKKGLVEESRGEKKSGQ